MEAKRDLRGAAREAVRDSRLPRAKPTQTWGGLGTERPCAICGEPTSRGEMAFELEFAEETRIDERGMPANHVVHPRCFELWEVERDGALTTAEPQSDLRDSPSGPTIPAHERDSFDNASRR